MKWSRLAVVAALMMSLPAASVRAQSEAPAFVPSAEVPTGIDAARDIRHNSLSVGLYKGFFSPIGVYRDGELLDIGIFGGDAGRWFNDTPQVSGHLRDHRRQKIAGVTLWSAGLAALVTDLAMVCAASGNRAVIHDHEVMWWSLLGSGIASSIVGAIVMNSANHSLEDAVNAHNANILNKYLPPDERAVPVLR